MTNGKKATSVQHRTVSPAASAVDPGRRRPGVDAVVCALPHTAGRAYSYGAAAAVALALCLVALMPAPALAGSRAFLRQITGTPTGPGGAEVAFNKPGGVAVDGSGDVWVTDALESETSFLDGFNESGGFVGRVELEDGQTIPGDLAFEDSTGHFYVTGEGTWNANPAYVEVFGGAGNTSPRPACSGLSGSIVLMWRSTTRRATRSMARPGRSM